MKDRQSTNYLSSALSYIASTTTDLIKAMPKVLFATFLSFPKGVMGVGFRMWCFYDSSLEHHYCLSCNGCNELDDKMLTLLTNECDIKQPTIFNVLGSADYPQQNFGTLANSTDPACILYISPFSKNNTFGPCVPDVLRINVTSSVPNDCDDSLFYFFIFIPIAAVVLSGLAAAGTLIYKRCSHRFFKTAANPENDQRYEEISNKFKAFYREDEDNEMMHINLR